eukprot:5175083-Heterocapsa_arctica.AAC.1
MSAWAQMCQAPGYRAQRRRNSASYLSSVAGVAATDMMAAVLKMPRHSAHVSRQSAPGTS